MARAVTEAMDPLGGSDELGSLDAELYKLFGVSIADQSQSSSKIAKQQFALLQSQAWIGSLCPEPLRGLCWRIFFGMLQGESYDEWCNELQTQQSDYNTLKKDLNTSFDMVEEDPLSNLSKGEKQSKEWDRYYWKLEMSNFIRIDLDRLYMPGIDEEYFHQTERKERLLAILLMWSLKYDRIAYRQGMHELVGTISYVLEKELIFWSEAAESVSHPLVGCFKTEYLEAYTYWIFDRIMRDLVGLYDPVPINNGPESMPMIVDYCTKIQEHFLRQIDPELCDRLEEAYIQGQIYGLRWARLLLGREFPLSHTHSLRIWDYMFATCYKLKKDANANEVLSELFSAQGSVTSAAKATHDERYGSLTPLMGVLGDFMLAMLLHIREQLVNGDSNEILGLLMKYPPCADVTPVMDLADMLRRGVLNCKAHLGPTSKNSRYARNRLFGQDEDQQRSSGSEKQPTWLLTNPILPVLNNNLHTMGKKVSEQLSAVSSAVNRSSNNLFHRTQHDPADLKLGNSLPHSSPVNIDPLMGSPDVKPRSRAITSLKNHTPLFFPKRASVSKGSELFDLQSKAELANSVSGRLRDIVKQLNPKSSLESEDIHDLCSRLQALANILNGSETITGYDSNCAAAVERPFSSVPSTLPSDSPETDASAVIEGSVASI